MNDKKYHYSALRKASELAHNQLEFLREAVSKMNNKKNEEFNYVVARLWDESKPATKRNLCIYAYGGEIQYGNIESARAFLNYARGKDENKKYNIYKIDFVKVES